MPHDHLESVRDAMWRLPFADRSALLITSIAEQEPTAHRFLFRLINLIDRLAAGLNPLRRWQVAELLRDIADKIEFPDDDEKQWRM